MPTPLDRKPTMIGEWWQVFAIYQVYPRSFQDSNHDGTGDLQGIISRLAHFIELGVGTIWLSPVFTSPMADFGYDISDYRGIDPLFGTMHDFMSCSQRAIQQDSRYCSTWYPIIHRHSIHGSWKAGRPPTIQSAIGSYGGILHQAGDLRTTGFLNSVGRAGNTTLRQDNTTTIRFLKSNRTSIGITLKCAKPSMTSCVSGWTGVPTAFAPMRSGIC
jgi:hypothetical protein